MNKYNAYQPQNWVAGDWNTITEDWVKTPLVVEGDLIAVVEATQDPTLWLETHDMILAVTVVDEVIEKMIRKSC